MTDDIKKPLQGRRILITRAAEQSHEVVENIQKLGGIPICIPMIEITGPDSWDECDNAIINIKKYNGIIFTSANAVRGFITRIENTFPHVKPMINLRTVYAVGIKTKETLEKYNIVTDAVPDEYTADAVITMIQESGCAGKTFLLPAGNLTRDVIENGLHKAGAVVDRVQVYTTKKPEDIDSVHLNKLLREETPDIITFFSPSGVHHFFELIHPSLLDTIAVAVIGSTTYNAVTEYGIKPDIKPDEATGEELVYKIAEFIHNHNQ